MPSHRWKSRYVLDAKEVAYPDKFHRSKGFSAIVEDTLDILKIENQHDRIKAANAARRKVTLPRVKFGEKDGKN